MTALRPLAISTPDGSGQTFHPDIVDTSFGFAGHRYWLACTPYPFGNDRLENPILRVSEDGTHWTAPAGAGDPLVEAPDDPSRHWSDTDLVLHGDTLFLFFRGCANGRAEAQVLLMTSADGVQWSSPTVVHTGEFVLSPAVVCEPPGWSMWHIWCDGSGARLLRQQAVDPRTWDEPQRCSLHLPGHVAWHIDVIPVATGYEALICAFPVGTDSSRCRLFHARSADGLTFTVSTPAPLLKPRLLGWPNRLVYRSTFLKRDDGTYRIWYSAASWGMRCGVGLVAGPLERLTPVTEGTQRPPRMATIREDLVGFATYVGLRRTPPRLRAALRRLVLRG